MRLYLAYGSNLDIEQMTRRCPGARPVGRGELEDWKLVFRVHATIEPCKGAHVPFALWEVTEDDELSLDRYEGYPKYYIKKFFTVRYDDIDSGKTEEAKVMAYVMTPGRPITAPFGGYLQTIIDGYEAFGLDTNVLQEAFFASLAEGRRKGA